MRPPPKDPPEGGDPPQQGMVKVVKPLGAPLHAGHLLPDGREVLISRHLVCEAEVE